MGLVVEHLSCGYDGQTIIHDVSLRVGRGEFATVLGSNNAGKSTLINCLSGLVPASHGRILLDDVDITTEPPHQRVRRGLVQVPEGRQLFAGMTVFENVLLGGRRGATTTESADRIAFVFDLFPRLHDRRRQVAGSLSGGEQQMLAMARGLMSVPTVLMLDEPSLGLAPLIVNDIFETMAALNDSGVTVLLVEQNLALSLRFASKGFVLERGEVVVSGSSDELSHNEDTRKAYLGL